MIAMTGKHVLPAKFGRAKIFLRDVQARRLDHPGRDQKLRLQRHNTVEVVSQDDSTLHLRAIEDLVFAPQSGPFRICLEIDGIFKLNEPLDCTLAKADIETMGEKLLLPHAATVIASITQFMAITPLILPPFIKDRGHADAGDKNGSDIQGGED